MIKKSTQELTTKFDNILFVSSIHQNNVTKSILMDTCIVLIGK